MAVYQISRIQIRRGQASSGTGLPQLASGEMAWAIDTQELYIGSGSVSEGAPAVSNVKVITEQDLNIQGNLLGLVQYSYKSDDPSIQTGPTSNSPVFRPILHRLDDQVNVYSFGAVGDGVTDDTAAIQRAIYQLFLNATNPASTVVSSRVELTLPAGTFKTTGTIYIPSYSTISGAGLDKTVINFVPDSATITGTLASTSTYTMTSTAALAKYVGYTISGNGIDVNTTITGATPGVSFSLSKHPTTTITGGTFTLTAPAPAFQFVNDSSTVSSVDPSLPTSTTLPRKVTFRDLTVNVTTGVNTGLMLNSVKDGLFENIKIIGTWPTAPANTSPNSVGIYMNGYTQLVTTENNIFNNVHVTGFYYDVFTTVDTLNNIFNECKFENSFQGFNLGVGGASSPANPNGPRQTAIVNSKFYNIKQQAVYIATGYANVTKNCKYINVGNNGGANTNAQYPQVYFASYGNSCSDDVSDRHTDLASPNVSTNATYALVPYVPEVSGHGTYQLVGTKSILLGQVATFIQILKLPVPWISTPAVLYNQVGATGPTGQITYVIDYYYQSLYNNFTRRGTLTISADITNKKIQLTDEYDYAGADPFAGLSNSIYLDFQAQFLDNTGATTLTNPWSIVVSYRNNLSSDGGYFNYTYKSIF